MDQAADIAQGQGDHEGAYRKHVFSLLYGGGENYSGRGGRDLLQYHETP
jgi:hypothetical protein